MSDTRGGIHCADGIDPADAHRHKRETGSLNGLAGCQAVTNEELLTLPCDILIPAALENQLRGDNARDVQARMIVELATARPHPRPTRSSTNERSRCCQTSSPTPAA